MVAFWIKILVYSNSSKFKNLLIAWNKSIITRNNKKYRCMLPISSYGSIILWKNHILMTLSISIRKSILSNT
jgi:hypothetical protein